MYLNIRAINQGIKKLDTENTGLLNSKMNCSLHMTKVSCKYPLTKKSLELRNGIGLTPPEIILIIVVISRTN